MGRGRSQEERGAHRRGALLDGRWSAPLRKAGVENTTVRGDLATELLRVAKRVRASMLVLGSRSHSNLADLIVGGTVHKVVNRSTIPVVLVPATPPAKMTASTRVAAAGRTSKRRTRSREARSGADKRR
jgi:K+-sensing histidine kinase KdpD